jgi:hypothetical protein
MTNPPAIGGRRGSIDGKGVKAVHGIPPVGRTPPSFEEPFLLATWPVVRSGRNGLGWTSKEYWRDSYALGAHVEINAQDTRNDSRVRRYPRGRREPENRLQGGLRSSAGRL